jgi:hypothetical protein
MTSPLAITSTCCPVSGLALSRRCLDGIDELTAHLGSRWTSCVSDTRSFALSSSNFFDEEFGHPLDESKLNFVANILRGAKCLISLSLELDEYRLVNESSTITKTLLFANDTANTKHLSLQAMVVLERDLSRIIEAGRTNLARLHLAAIQLVERDQGWTTIFRSIMTLPNLDFLSLSSLYVWDAPADADVPMLDFQKLDLGVKMADTHLVLCTKHIVAAGLRELLSGPLSLSEPDMISVE